MGLYKDRDYFYITEEENKEYQMIYESECFDKNGNKLPIGRKNKYREYPKAIRHNQSLFPNQFMDPVDLENEVELKDGINKFQNLIYNKNTKEIDILRHINSNESYYIIASIIKHYNFGHHATYLFKEFQLGVSYRADYLLVGQSSGGFEFIFIELESCYGKITLKDGEFGESIRKGLNQIDDWKIWLEENYCSLSEIYSKFKNKSEGLPMEFIKYDSSRIHFVVVAGTRNDFNDKTYRLKRNLLNDKRIKLLHYDNLIDFSYSLIGENSY